MERKLFYSHRPMKIAYIIDDSVSVETLKDIMLFNMTARWGRYYQFFLLDSSSWTQKISDVDKQRMRTYDADIYVCLCKIDQELKDYIIVSFSPSEILESTQVSIANWHVSLNWKYIRINPVTVMPCKELIWKIWFRNPKLMNFLIDKDLPTNLRDAIGINFWYIENVWGYYKHYLETIEHEELAIKSLEDLKGFLEKTNSNHFVYPNQLSHVPYDYLWKLDYKSEDIYVVVWNSIKDYLMFWNRNIHRSSWKAVFLNTFFLPITGLNGNETIINVFLKFAHQYSRNQNQNGQKPNVILISNVFSKEELEKINPPSWTRIGDSLDIYEWSEFTNYEYIPLDHRKYVSLYEEDATVRLDKEVLWKTHMADETYVTDVCLEYQKSNQVMTADWRKMVSYLQYNRNNKAIQWIFGSRIVRVNKNRSFSIIFNKAERESWLVGWDFDDNRFELSIKIPAESVVIRSMMIASRFWDEYKRNFDDIKQSSDWMRVRAILNLFWWDLLFLEDLLNHKQWRELFIKYTQVFKKENIIENIEEVLASKQELDTKIISEKIYDRCFKTANISEKYISLSTLKKELEITDDQSVEAKDIMEELEHLTNSSIIRQWIEFKCRFCHERYWISTGEMSENIKCRWCWKKSPINVAPEWNYAFNSILNWTDSKWIFAVLNFLTDLAWFHSDSFLYWLWIECMDWKGSIWESDIVCLKNWRLILSEVKYSRDWFSQDDFTKLKTISEKVIPDAIIFASYGTPTGGIKKNIKEWGWNVKKELDKYGVKIIFHSIWSPIHDI